MLPLNKLSDLLRQEVAMAGWTEALSFALCSRRVFLLNNNCFQFRDDISISLRRPEALLEAVLIANPKTQEFQVTSKLLLVFCSVFR